jgi:hypothetical protein
MDADGILEIIGFQSDNFRLSGCIERSREEQSGIEDGHKKNGKRSWFHLATSLACKRVVLQAGNR